MAGQRIFLSYRRADSGSTVERLHDVLATSFGPESVFRDLDAIALGRPFDHAVGEAIRQCRVCFVVIGPGWLHASGPDGVPRLQRPDDPVAEEVRTALQSDVAVIPVLVDGATMPDRSQLPAALADLALRNAFVLRPEVFHADLARLIGQIGDHDPAALAARVRPAAWDDVVLPGPTWQALQQAMLHLRHGPELHRQFGRLAEDSDAAPTVLVWGPSGCGKSLVARALSRALELDLYRIELDDVLLRWQSGDRLPIDWLYRRIGASRIAVHLRDAGSAAGEGAATAAMLMKTLLRHLRRRDGLLIVTRPTATASAYGDPAGHRFDHVVHLPFPDAAARCEIWRRLMPFQVPLFSDVSPEALAEQPLSGLGIRLAIRQAALNALDQGRAVGQQDLLQAAAAFRADS